MVIGKQTEYTVILVFPSMFFFPKNFIFLPNFIIEAGITIAHHVFSSWTKLIGLPVRSSQLVDNRNSLAAKATKPPQMDDSGAGNQL